jgi:hypothetical protein
MPATVKMILGRLFFSAPCQQSVLLKTKHEYSGFILSIVFSLSAVLET